MAGTGSQPDVVFEQEQVAGGKEMKIFVMSPAGESGCRCE